MDKNSVVSTVKGRAEKAHDSQWMDHLARAGLVAYGVVHLLVAWVAVQLAFGESRREASSKGAFSELASHSFGKVALWALAVGLVLLVVWKVLDAVFGKPDDSSKDGEGWRQRGGAAVKAVLYAALALTALRTVTGGGGGKGRSMTATVMNWPGGQWLVALAGLAVIGYAGYLAWKGWTDKFLEHLDAEGRAGETGEAYRWFGKIGHLAKAVATGIVGGLVVHAGWTHQGKEDQGLGDALRTVLQQPFGPWLLCVIAAGIACYGFFCFARARHLDR
ncbi:DUF1206 domain-containing protein [Nocardioides daphniae]|uniref:DUF1206 domain-containing protein n=1 Tax=Nocardioides daphniae TaxID=402297 RepID=A0A4P7UCU7_9ACTN|nr:DUF1206 domain-containing protein [Nocardioides daphniae]QCC77118.1 DUF1206 domain-containing protein [Nocardioides daphniae]GGD19782.1 membrane protein [Nocardioides daphniae]